MKPWLVATLVAATHVVGCPAVEPCFGVDEGDTVVLTLKGRWDTTSPDAFIRYQPLPSCEGVDVPEASSVLKMGDGTEEGLCLIPSCPTDFPSPSSQYRGGGIPGDRYVCTSPDRKIRIGGCEAARQVVIRQVFGDDPFGSPPPGGTPRVVLIRQLGYAPGAADLVCDDPLSIFPEEASDDGVSFACSDAWIIDLARK